MRLSIISVAGGLLLPEQVCILQQDAKVYWLLFFFRPVEPEKFSILPQPPATVSLIIPVCQFFLQFRNPQDAYN